MMIQITILGLGNPLLGDDGVGPRVVRELLKGGLPPGVEAVEAGGTFFSYWDALARSRYVLAVDALRGGGPPGTVYLLTTGEIAREKEDRHFRHEDDFPAALELLARFGVRPEVAIVGVEPKEIVYSLELSPEVAEKIPAVVKIIRELYTLLLREGDSSHRGLRAHPLF